MNMKLVYSTTHLDQETARHFAVLTDENMLHNVVVEWKEEEILLVLCLKSIRWTQCAARCYLTPSYHRTVIKHVILKRARLIEILIMTSNRFGPSEKKSATKFYQKGGEKDYSQHVQF